MSKLRKSLDDVDISFREDRLLRLHATLKAANKCTLCPPHAGENRRRSRRGAKKKRKTFRRKG